MIPESLYHDVMDYHRRFPGGSFPPHMAAKVEQIERHLEAERAELYTIRELGLVNQIEAEISHSLPDRASRRKAEQKLADYIGEIADEYDATGHRKLHELSESLRHCRVSGVVGARPSGGYVVAWDQKCGQVRLCPDESREETQRLAKKYVPAMLEWLKGNGRRRVFYAVFTDHNFRPDHLYTGKRYLIDKFKTVMHGKADACPVEFGWKQNEFSTGYHKGVIPSRKRKLHRFPNLKGSMIIQEDPLSKDLDWNVHLNAFLMWEGPCSFKEIRQEWGANIQIREIKRDDLTRALLEAVKYSAQIVPTKSDDKAKRHATEAPAMTEWPPLRWLEWWEAQRGFRRVRSYGCLYKVPALEEDAFDMSLVEWVGNIRFTSRGAYEVDLIPGNNFSGSRVSSDGKNRFGIDENPETGPPDPWASVKDNLESFYQ